MFTSKPRLPLHHMVSSAACISITDTISPTYNIRQSLLYRENCLGRALFPIMPEQCTVLKVVCFIYNESWL